MKQMINILTHPLAIIISFLSLIIIGQHLGGFYLLYILLALPHFGIHAVLAVAGIGILLVNNYILHKQSSYLISPVLNITGALMLPLSLFLFFYLDDDRYNEATLKQAVPLLLIGIFIVLTAGFIVKNINKASGRKPAGYAS